MSVPLGQFSLDRMVSAVEKVRRRLLRATSVLEAARIGYAVAGGNAVAAWVSKVDEAAVPNTQDVDILIRRRDLQAVKTAMELEGFVYRHAPGMDIFLDGPDASPRSAVHLVFAGEQVRPDEPLANPDVEDSEQAGHYRVLSLESLVRIKLTAFRDKDRVHLRDLIEVGLVDQTWPARLPEVLARRLEGLLRTPGG